MLTAPFTATGQDRKIAKIGVLCARPPIAERMQALEDGLRELGWVRGRNLNIEYRIADGVLERLPSLAADLVGLNMDVIIAVAAPETAAARQATKTIPIIFVVHGDPVGSGDVATFARPGGNVTGLGQMAPEVTSKQIEILKEVVPRMTRVAVIWNAGNPTKAGDWREVTTASHTLGVVLQSREVRRAADFSDAFAAIRRERPDALLTLVDPLTVSMRRSIVDFAAKEHLPAMYASQIFVDSGA